MMKAEAAVQTSFPDFLRRFGPGDILNDSI